MHGFINREAARLLPWWELLERSDVLRHDRRQDFPLHIETPLRTALKSEDAPPVVLHADNDLALSCRLVVQRLSEGADFGVGQPERRPVGVFALCVVVQ